MNFLLKKCCSGFFVFRNNTIVPNINNKFMITSYKKKWNISNTIFYINYDRSKIIYFCYRQKGDGIYLAKISKYKKNELDVIKKLENMNYIIQIKELFYNQYGSIIIMKYYPNLDLKKYLSMSYNYSLDIIIFNLLQCIISLHKMKIYHRDIKLENFIIDNKYGFKILLSDFEMATDNLLLNNKQGSLYYLPPEYFTNKYVDNKKRDFWALGVVIYFLIYKVFPFNGNSFTEIKYNILNRKIPYNKVNKKYKLLLINLLNKNPKKRLIIEL